MCLISQKKKKKERERKMIQGYNMLLPSIRNIVVGGEQNSKQEGKKPEVVYMGIQIIQMFISTQRNRTRLLKSKVTQ